MFELTAIRHAFPEKELRIERSRGHRDYTFLHFFHSVDLLCGGEVIRTKPHAVILFNMGTPQFFSTVTPMVHDWLHFRGDPSSMLTAAGLRLDTLYYPSSFDFITTLTREMETEFYSSHPQRQRLIEMKAEELFIKLGRAVTTEQEAEIDLGTQAKFRYLRGEMFSSLEEKWPVERMAALAGFSPSRFYSIYKSLYGISPAADLIDARIGKAMTLLQTGHQTVDAIAGSLGYENTTHFIRQFRQHTGLSPTAYRRQMNERSE